jgi:hypothetical protein
MDALEIQVRNGADREPLPEAWAILDGALVARTGAQGRATMEMPAAAAPAQAYHSLVVFAPQYRPYYLQVHHTALVTLGFSLDICLEMCPPPPADGWGWGMDAVKARAAHKLGPLPVKIGILDVGIDRSHPCLRVAGGLCAAAPGRGKALGARAGPRHVQRRADRGLSQRRCGHPGCGSRDGSVRRPGSRARTEWRYQHGHRGRYRVGHSPRHPGPKPGSRIARV